MSATFSGKNPLANIKAAQLRGAELAAEHLLGESRKLVPIEEGTLERSGAASQSSPAARRDWPSRTTRRTPSCSTRRCTTSTTPARQAKYLETAFNSQGDTALEVIARAVRGEF